MFLIIYVEYCTDLDTFIILSYIIKFHSEKKISIFPLTVYLKSQQIPTCDWTRVGVVGLSYMYRTVLSLENM